MMRKLGPMKLLIALKGIMTSYIHGEYNPKQRGNY